jgi:hypothetical protein
MAKDIKKESQGEVKKLLDAGVIREVKYPVGVYRQACSRIPLAVGL